VVSSLVFVPAAARAQAAAAPAADAPPSPKVALPVPGDGEVERHAALGQRLLERGRTQEALVEFRRAYELRADPRLLYDIAACYRQLGNTAQARFFYERYLAAAPDAPDRDEVEAALDALGAPAAPASTKPAPAPSPSFAHDAVLVPVAPPPEAPRPLWRRWWVWTAFGALVLAGVAAALLTQKDDTTVPSTALGDKRFY
jgi:tetratricopeptide (TPR) repeat protein